VSALLEVRGLTRSFGDLRAVADLSFAIPRGQVWGFIGPNGAGKTTTMRICATLDLPDAGDALLDGRSLVLEPETARPRIGFMPDALGAYALTTVAEYLDFFARAYGLDAARRRERIEAVAAFADLGGMMDRMTDRLSKGMGQRLCLAKTLLHDPDLLILDEPANGLDPRARVEFRELIRALAARGKTVLISSHILAELSEICEGVIVIERGRLVRAGAIGELARDLSRHVPIFLRALAAPGEVEMALAEEPGVQSMRAERDGWILDFDGDAAAQAALLASLVARGLRPIEFRGHQANLEDVFLSYTRGELQ
jgi:ABC-2 type transport system ATP-binding protein